MLGDVDRLAQFYQQRLLEDARLFRMLKQAQERNGKRRVLDRALDFSGDLLIRVGQRLRSNRSDILVGSASCSVGTVTGSAVICNQKK